MTVLTLSIYIVPQRIQVATGEPADAASTYVHWVRKVAPNKDMYCVSFRLTPDMVFAETRSD
jgi:tRNA (guanine37-N1)-methyltransferase